MAKLRLAVCVLNSKWSVYLSLVRGCLNSIVKQAKSTYCREMRERRKSLRLGEACTELKSTCPFLGPLSFSLGYSQKYNWELGLPSDQDNEFAGFTRTLKTSSYFKPLSTWLSHNQECGLVTSLAPTFIPWVVICKNAIWPNGEPLFKTQDSKRYSGNVYIFKFLN